MRNVNLRARIQVNHDIAYKRDSVHAFNTLRVISSRTALFPGGMHLGKYFG